MPAVSPAIESTTTGARKSFVCKGKPGVAMPVSTPPSSPLSAAAAAGACRHADKAKSPATATTTTAAANGVCSSRCPHVILIGDIYVEDLDAASLIALQQRRKSEIRARLENGDRSRSDQDDDGSDDEEEEEENDDEDDNEDEDEAKQIVPRRSGGECPNRDEAALTQHLTCDDCDQRKNLWLCLRENCLYVGCGQSNLKHSTNHAQNFHHPLSMNLGKKSVWCEICNRPVVLEHNYPPYKFKTRSKHVADAADGRLIYDDPARPLADARSLMFNQAYEQHARATSNVCAGAVEAADCSSDFSLVEFIEQDIDPNREAYDKSGGLDEAADNGQRLSYEDLPVRNGLVGLDNLGNTCYMNSALQALSNCLAFTSFFLECSQFIESVVPGNAATSASAGASTAAAAGSGSVACLSISYMKLMRELWQKRNSKNKRQLASSISPSELVQTIKFFNAMFRGYSQHDSQEFILYLLDQLHEELKRPLLVTVRPSQPESTTSAATGDGGEQENESNVDEDDRTVIQQQQNKVARSDSSALNDSNPKRARKKSKSRSSYHHQSTNESAADDSDGSDSYETCGGGDSAATSSDLSEKLHFSDVEESPQTSMSFECSEEAVAGAGEHESTRDLLNKLDEFRKSRLSNKNTNSSVSNITDITDSGISTVHSQDSSVASKAPRASKKNGKPAVVAATTSAKTTSEPAPTTKPDYASIVSDLFNGQIIGQVQCLECKHLSTTTETFQHLSLPIPSKEYLQALHSKVVQHQNATTRSDRSEAADDEEDEDEASGAQRATDSSASVPYQSWLSWMVDFMKGYIWSPTIKLSECLTAFFSDDDLKGDNMYSCENCKKLTNGVKYSKVLSLPEILCVHLKRFRHDSMFATGKVNTYVSFPIDGLEMKPFIHKDCKNQYTSYDLCSIICHYGGANGGHYTSYARNYANEEWYEYDDSFCRQVDTLAVQNAQAYVLFYKKRNTQMDSLKEELHDIVLAKAKSNHMGHSLLRSYYVSKQWLHRFKYFSEPGPVDNSDFLCKHNYVQPYLWAKIESLTSLCSYETWDFFVRHFGVKYADVDEDESETTTTTLSNGNGSNGAAAATAAEQLFRPKTECVFLYPCAQCQLDDEALKQRQYFEKSELLRLREKFRAQQFQIYQPQSQRIVPLPAPRSFAISMSWFKQWEQFVHSNQARSLAALVPGKINNFSICVQQNKAASSDDGDDAKRNPPVYVLNKNSSFGKISEEMWNFLHGIYGGGPAIPIGPPAGATAVTRTPRNPSCSLSSLTLSSSPES